MGLELPRATSDRQGWRDVGNGQSPLILGSDYASGLMDDLRLVVGNGHPGTRGSVLATALFPVESSTR
jgi:hypothetical protein